MAQEILTYVKCPQCHGTGTFKPASGPGGSGSLPCNWPGCGTSGYVEFGRYGENLYFAYQVMDNTVAGEYNALSDANKAAYNMVLSCGVIDLSSGSATHTKLWNIFGSGTTTRTNLETLIA